MTTPMPADQAAKVLRSHRDSGLYESTEIDAAIDAAVAALEGLKDPGTVLVNMMRGTIANPHADTAARCDALAEENALLREYLELAASAKTVSWMTEGRPPACRCDTITERARELIGLHLSEQEGMIQPTAAQFMAAVDALAQAIGASHLHPRERALRQDAKRGNFRQEDDGA